MEQLNIPSESALIYRDKLMKAVQELYGSINTLSTTAQFTDITALSSDDIEALTVGQTLVNVSGDKRYAYVVSYKDDTAGELSLTYINHEVVVEVHYEKSGGTWAYTTTDTTNL